MTKFYLIESGKQNGEVTLPNTPSRGDVISHADFKFPVYLVLRVEYVTGYEEINLHVKQFANQTAAVNEVDGFRN